jgi:hypothetical protein
VPLMMAIIRPSKKISIFGDGIVDANHLTNENGPGTKHGGNVGNKHTLELGINEWYVTSVFVRHGNLVQSWTFITTRGNMVQAGAAYSVINNFLYDK